MKYGRIEHVDKDASRVGGGLVMLKDDKVDEGFAMAGVTHQDIDVVSLYDGFASWIVMQKKNNPMPYPCSFFLVLDSHSILVKASTLSMS